MNRIHEIEDLQATLIETMAQLREIDPNALDRVLRAIRQVFHEGVIAA